MVWEEENSNEILLWAEELVEGQGGNIQVTALPTNLQLGGEVKARKDWRIFYLFVSLFILLFYSRIQALGKAQVF